MVEQKPVALYGIGYFTFLSAMDMAKNQAGRLGMVVDRGKAGIRPNPSRLDRGWTIRIGWWTDTGIPV